MEVNLKEFKPIGQNRVNNAERRSPIEDCTPGEGSTPHPTTFASTTVLVDATGQTGRYMLITGYFAAILRLCDFKADCNKPW